MPLTHFYTDTADLRDTLNRRLKDKGASGKIIRTEQPDVFCFTGFTLVKFKNPVNALLNRFQTAMLQALQNNIKEVKQIRIGDVINHDNDHFTASMSYLNLKNNAYQQLRQAFKHKQKTDPNFIGTNYQMISSFLEEYRTTRLLKKTIQIDHYDSLNPGDEKASYFREFKKGIQKEVPSQIIKSKTQHNYALPFYAGALAGFACLLFPPFGITNLLVVGLLTLGVAVAAGMCAQFCANLMKTEKKTTPNIKYQSKKAKSSTTLKSSLRIQINAATCAKQKGYTCGEHSVYNIFLAGVKGKNPALAKNQKSSMALRIHCLPFMLKNLKKDIKFDANSLRRDRIALQNAQRERPINRQRIKDLNQSLRFYRTEYKNDREKYNEICAQLKKHKNKMPSERDLIKKAKRITARWELVRQTQKQKLRQPANDVIHIDLTNTKKNRVR